MAEFMLETFFDRYIAGTHEEEEEEEEEEDLDCDIFSLPDELLALLPASGTEPDLLPGKSRTISSTGLDSNSQNPTAGGSSVTPVTPVTPAVLLKVNNVMATVNLGCLLHLKAIAQQAPNVEYKPQVFPALVMRIRKPKATALIYSSGKMVCSGANSVENAHRASRRFGRILQRLQFPVRFLDFKVRNIVAAGQVFPVRLEGLRQLPMASYEPEIFPGLFLKTSSGVSVIVFTTGKICLTGAETEEQMQEAFSSILPYLEAVRR